MRLLRLLTGPTLLLPLHGPSFADAITGRVADANGVGVAGVDIDFVNLESGGNPHEANDGTDANGRDGDAQVTLPLELSSIASAFSLRFAVRDDSHRAVALSHGLALSPTR